jgi:lactoylglutathione lyase
MARGEVFPIVNCRDLPAMREFYVRALGGEQAYQFPPDGEPVYLTLRIGAGQVALGLGTAPALYGEIPLPATGHAVDVCVYVPDLDAAVAAAPEAGGAVAVPPADMPWGERVAYLRDPEGTMLLVIQDE